MATIAGAVIAATIGNRQYHRDLDRDHREAHREGFYSRREHRATIATIGPTIGSTTTIQALKHIPSEAIAAMTPPRLQLLSLRDSYRGWWLTRPMD